MDAICRKADINPHQVADKAEMFRFIRNKMKGRLKRQLHKRDVIGPEVEDPNVVVDKRNRLEPFELLLTDLCGPFDQSNTTFLSIRGRTISGSSS